MAKSMTVYSDTSEQDNINSVLMGCGDCSKEYALFTSLPNPSSSDSSKGMASSSTRVICWECPNCGANYMTLISTSNLRLSGRATTRTINFAMQAFTSAVDHMRTMLSGICYTGRHSEEDQNGSLDQ